MKKVKIISWIALVIGLTLSVFFNVKNQFLTLREAKNKNYELENKIIELKTDKQKLMKQIEFATSSAFVDQQTHEKLALGTENDVWLILPTETEIDLRPKINETQQIAKYKQWLNLFTQ
ncbi:MAG: hypothetical protein PHX34_03840 [Candidatus Shapirobacteria bacterium]|nr:hypothetical protein [Candidatus Shapirobacteria bacterium]